MLFMSEVSKVHTGPSIQSNVTHAKGVKSTYKVPQHRTMLFMSEVSKVHTGPSIQSNVTHVEGVVSTYRVPQYRTMSKVDQYIL